MSYCNTGYTEVHAMEDPSAINDIMKAFMDNQILTRTKKKLQEAKTVKELFQVLKDEEQVFWTTKKTTQSFYQEEMGRVELILRPSCLSSEKS